MTIKKSWFKKGEEHPLWKGDKASYRSVHAWVVRELGKANKCENDPCIWPRMVHGRLQNAPKKFNWANISREYKRDLSDWKQLCVSCHNKYDMTPERLEHLKMMTENLKIKREQISRG